jgi:hypothetical protein
MSHQSAEHAPMALNRLWCQGVDPEGTLDSVTARNPNQ